MSDIDLQDALGSALHLVHPLRLMSEGLGRSDEASAICAVSGLVGEKLEEIRDALAARQEAAI